MDAINLQAINEHVSAYKYLLFTILFYDTFASRRKPERHGYTLGRLSASSHILHTRQYSPDP